jgi:predicted dienelactone hydrolase
MKFIAWFFLLQVALLQPAWAQSDRTGRAVGFEEVRIPNGTEPPLVAGIWYPTRATPREEPLEGNRQRVAHGGAIRGSALPLVLISHGGGGSYAGHYDTALALARAGFVVAAVSHAGDTYDDQSGVLKLWRRPAQLRHVLDYMLSQWPAHDHIAPGRIGAFGFSNGGFTVVAAAGGVPEVGRIDAYCRDHPDHDLCTALRDAGVPSVAGLQPPPGAWRADPRIRAIVASAPAFGFTFDATSLSRIQIPVQLWRPALDRHQPHPFYEEPLRAALGGPVDYRVVARAGHFAFLPRCGEALAIRVPAVCTDGPGFDRSAFHQTFNAAVVRFFQKTLPAQRGRIM